MFKPSLLLSWMKPWCQHLYLQPISLGLDIMFTKVELCKFAPLTNCCLHSANLWVHGVQNAGNYRGILFDALHKLFLTSFLSSVPKTALPRMTTWRWLQKRLWSPRFNVIFIFLSTCLVYIWPDWLSVVFLSVLLLLCLTKHFLNLVFKGVI